LFYERFAFVCFVYFLYFFFFQAEDGIRDFHVTGVQTCALPIFYRKLQREEFDAVLQMLAEGYSTRRGRSGVLLHLDRINGRARARRGARLMALTNGGAIPDMFDYQVVLDPEDIVVGSLNEDFALETLPGDVFSLGTHSWRL